MKFGQNTVKVSSFENSGFYTFNVDFDLLIFYRLRQKTQALANRSEFEAGEGPFQKHVRSGNGVPSTGKDLCRVGLRIHAFSPSKL